MCFFTKYCILIFFCFFLNYQLIYSMKIKWRCSIIHTGFDKKGDILRYFLQWYSSLRILWIFSWLGKFQRSKYTEATFLHECVITVGFDWRLAHHIWWMYHREEPPQNPNKSAKVRKNVLFSWEFLHGWKQNWKIVDLTLDTSTIFPRLLQVYMLM